MKKKVNFMSLLLTLCMLPLLLSLTISTLISANKMYSSLENGVYQKLNVACESLANYYKYDISNGILEYEEDYVDSLKEQDIELTVFKDNTRFMTSIYKDGTTERNVGTNADVAIYEAVKNGKTIEKNGVSIGGEDYYVTYKPMYDGDGNFWGMAFAGTPQKDVKNTIFNSVLNLFIVSIILVVISVVIIIIISTQIKNMIKDANEHLLILSSGDISNNKKMKSSTIREIDSILKSTNDLKTTLNGSIFNIKTNSDNLKDSIDEVRNKTKFNVESVEQINSAIEEVATTSQVVSTSAVTLAERSTDLGGEIESLSENVDILKKESNNIKLANNDAIEYMNNVLKASEDSVNVVNQIVGYIENTDNAVAEINKALDILESIASETKLLSLNASIEASHAGEAGKGFAVVAESVKDLANSSSENVDKIGDVIKKIVTSSSESVNSAVKVKEAILNQQQLIFETKDKFNTLSNSIDNSISEIESIFDKTKNLTAIKVDFIESTEALSAISEELGASAEEVSASCSVVLGACSETQDKTNNMQEINESLIESVSFFK